MLRSRRKISARAVAIDVIAGADDRALMAKYRLAPEKLERLLKQLLEAQVITETDLAMRDFLADGVICSECNSTNPFHYKFCGHCGADLSWRCSDCGATAPRSSDSCARCGAEAAAPNGRQERAVIEKTPVPGGGRMVIRSRVLRDIRSGFGYQALLRKYRMSPRGFATLSKVFLRAGDLTRSQLARINRSRSGLECRNCGSPNSFQDKFCGNCGHEVGQPSPHGEPTLAPCNDKRSDRATPDGEFEQGPGNTFQKASDSRDDNRFIQEIRAAVSNVMTPLRNLTRSGKKVNEAFYQACKVGRIGKVFNLLAAGADINGDESVPPLRSDETNGHQSWLHPLGVAAKNGREDVVMLLLDKGADVNKRGGFDLRTALMETRSAIVAHMLLDFGADIDAADLQVYTALMSAASDGCIDLVRLLLSRGSNVNAVNADGDTALMCASQHGPCQPSHETPAFNRDYPGVVKVLLEKGANISITNKDGFSALQLAEDCGHQEIVSVLRDAGACEPLEEVDDNILGLVISMIRARLDASRHYSPDICSGISNYRKSVRLSNAGFFLSVSMLGNVACIDGGPNRAEMSCLRRFIAGSPWRNWLQIAEDIFYECGDTSRNGNAIVAAFKMDVGAFVRLFGDHETSIRTVGDELFQMATSDGPVNQLESHLLDLFAAEVERSTEDGHYRQTDSDEQQGYDPEKIVACYVALKCDEADSDAHIRSRYKKLAKEYHPDSIQGKGLPEDFILFANRKFQEIQECYEIIMDYRKKRCEKS